MGSKHIECHLACDEGVVALRDVLHEALLELVVLRLVHALAPLHAHGPVGLTHAVAEVHGHTAQGTARAGGQALSVLQGCLKVIVQ